MAKKKKYHRVLLPKPKQRHSRPATRVIHDGREYTREQIEFMVAMEQYIRRTGQRYPTCRAVLQVAHTLGYHKEL